MRTRAKGGDAVGFDFESDGIRPGEFDGENDIIGFATNLTLLFRLFFCRLHSQGGDDSKSVRKGESFDEAKASAGGKAIG